MFQDKTRHFYHDLFGLEFVLFNMANTISSFDVRRKMKEKDGNLRKPMIGSDSLGLKNIEIRGFEVAPESRR
jgi:hypothetical protein